MANENREEFKGDHLVAIETVAATVEAFGRGEIELEAVAKETPKAHIYHVPAGASSILRSLSTDLRKVASATTHGSRRPCADAAIVDDTMSPAPMPAAATSSPGPISLTTLARAAAVSCA